MLTRARCSLCRSPVFRDRNGRLTPHTFVEVPDEIGLKIRTVVCDGSDWKALS